MSRRRRRDVALRTWLAPAALCGVLVVLVAALAGQCAPRTPRPGHSHLAQPPLAMATIRIDGTAVRVEVAGEPEQRRMGYMYRDPPPEVGMLFVWPEADFRSFWMKNTYFPIDLAYIDPDGAVVQIERMLPHRVTSVPSRTPVQYVLEMPAGRFAELGIDLGDTVEIPADLASRSAPDGPNDE